MRFTKKTLLLALLTAATGLNAAGAHWTKAIINHSKETWTIVKPDDGNGNLTFDHNGTSQKNGNYVLKPGNRIDVTYTTTGSDSNGTIILVDKNHKYVTCKYKGSGGWVVFDKKEVKITHCVYGIDDPDPDIDNPAISKVIKINSPYSGDIGIWGNQLIPQ